MMLILTLGIANTPILIMTATEENREFLNNLVTALQKRQSILSWQVHEVRYVITTNYAMDLVAKAVENY